MNVLAIITWCLTYSVSEGNFLDISDIRLVNGAGPYGGRVEIQLNGIWGTVCDDSFDLDDATVMCRMMNLTASTYVTGAWYGQGIGPIYAQGFQCSGYETQLKDCPYVPNVQCTHARDIGVICSECPAIGIYTGYVTDISADGTVLSAICNDGFASNATSTCSKGMWSPPSILCQDDIRDIRLENGLGLYDGRVELLVNGTWGTICSTSFSYREARALCNILFGTTWYRNYETTSSDYGPGTGPIHIDNLGCTGYEKDINECSYSLDVACTDHSRDAAVACDVRPLNITATRLVNGTGPHDGRIELYVDGHWGTICNRYIDVFDAQTICNTHNASLTLYFTETIYGKGTGPVLIHNINCYSNSDHINDCTVYLPYRPYCTHDYDLSIVCTSCGLPKIYNGEAFSFNNTELTVKCQQGFFPDYIKMRCLDNGTWVEIQRCSSYNAYPLNISDIRLRNSYGVSNEGRVEFLVNGTWGTVCDTDFDMEDAAVICRMLNLAYKGFYTNAGRFGRGNGTIFVDKLNCNGTEKHISNCTYEISNHCSHDDDVAVLCTGTCGQPKIYNGEAFSSNSTDLTVKCQPGFFPDYIKMRCLDNGTWVEIQRCSSYNAYPLNISDIRLRNSYGFSHEGRVEFLVNGTWGTVCDTDFDMEDAAVICRMLNLEYKGFYTNAGRFGRGSGTIFVDKLNCSGTENHISNCTYEISNYCTHYDDVAVLCTGYQLNITDIRLAGTNGPYHGRVELEVNGTWGTVCGFSFSWPEAEVLCRMLGLEYSDYYYNAWFGRGSGPIYLDRLDCYYWYLHINDCKYGVNNYYDCDHGDDVSVVCYGPRLNITDTRLGNGTGPYDGRAEIKVGDTWGTICDENFNILDADLFCGTLGLRAVRFYTEAFYGEGSGPVFIDQLFCNKYDYELINCNYLFLNECTHERDVSVVCNECGQPDISHWDAGFLNYIGTTLYADCSYYKTYLGTLKLTCDNDTQTWVTEGECQEYSYPLNVTDVRLVNGLKPSQGRVELKSFNTWGTICDDNFGMSEANFICNIVGYPLALSFHTDAFFGEGTGPIFVDEFDCTDNASNFNDCTYTTYDDCTHGDDISVVCTDCGDPTPEHGFANTSSTGYLTIVHVTCKKNYKLIGEKDIVCQANGTWSNQPVCKLIDCGDPTPVHGSSNSSDTTNGTVLLLECEQGYNMTGDAIITCQLNETWTDIPYCEIIDCGEPKPENADVNLLGNKTTYGETAVISCWQGYKSIGTMTVSCLANGTWDVLPQCILIDCGNPVPAKGSANTTVTTYGTVVEIACPTGYNISGNSIIKCQDDGTWTDSPVCDSSDCGVLSVPNGEANTTFGTSTGAIATIKCDEGYSLNGSSVVICTTSGWNDSSLSCEVQYCDDPTPTNGEITNTDASNGYIFGSYAEIGCNVGYELNGDNVITCEDGGIWTYIPSCELKDCGNLSAPAEGSMDHSQGTRYRAQITFNCNAGYLLDGEAKTMCDEQGEWTNPAPTCVRKSEIGEACTRDEYCLFEDSKCENSICKCITGIYEEASRKCDIMPLLPYGTSEGDTSLPKGQRCSAKVSFELGFPAFSKTHKDVFVCWYGYLSLDAVYANPTPPNNRNRISGLGRKRILAPFNAPINIENSGAVFYRSLDIRNSYEKMKENVKLISYIEMIVRKFGNTDSFDANFVLIATWDKARPRQGFDTSKSSTFQAVLTSDGRTSYVFYIYGYGKMQWVNKLSRNPRVWVGFSVDTVAYNQPYSFSNSVLRLDSKLSVSSSENDVSGLVFQPIMQPGEMNENAAVDCVKWYNDNYEDKKRLDFIASMTPECPCDIWLSRFDPWFWKIGLQRRRKDTTYACVDMLHVGIFGHFGKRCCYDLRTWLWVYERPYAGGFQLYNTRFPLQNILNDVIPKTKCCYQSDNCNLYYELRPTGRCYRTSPYDFGTFWGDPHFRTLDGLNFTFNGLGEYVLLQVRANKTFDLHARTERPAKQDGSLSEATVFTAFAAKDSTGASVHVELNKEKSGINLYGNKVDLTTLYYESNDTEDPFEWTSDENNLIISKRDQTLSVLFPSFGISLNISVSLEMLSLITLVNKTLRGHTQGLLGNYNGNPDDDFTLPNGTVLNSNLTERDVFKYGQTWEVHGDNSAFIYENGQNHSSYHNYSYVPKFLDEADPIKVNEAITVCNGSQNIQCVFDLVFIDKPEVALMTNDIKSESDITRSELDESVPSLTGCGTIKSIKGEEATCSFTAEEDADVYFLENNVNATINRTFSSVKFIQKNEEPITIRIASRNRKGRSSTPLVIEVLVCTKCNDHGNCTDYPRDEGQNNGYYRIASCVCEPEYEGPDCENEFDGCAANPCSLNRTCISLSPKDQKLLDRSYNCSACPDGFTEDDKTECSDIDECAADTDDCHHNCINTEGGFECSCREGYTIDSQNQSKCKDMNECEESLHNCTYKCSNTEGGFTCGCFPGYTLDTDTGYCSLSENATCSPEEADACAETDGCTVENDKTVCFCRDGYELDDTGKLCNDIDECSRGICPHDCINTNGSYECMCYQGYRLEGRTQCEECDVLHWGENCMNICICNGRGANRCDNVKGCVCNEGWQGDTCNIDIDECASPNQNCNDPRRQCVNILGSYTCECKTGFTESEEGKCEDMDECSDPRLNTCTQLCENTFGSYSCKCKTGFTKENETACTDIDECKEGISLCDQICVNNPGKHSCACNIGYTLSDDRTTCIKVSDPCLETYNLTCSHFCLVENDNAKCDCRAGYVLSADNITCTDINECDEGVAHKCDDNANCTNTDGSFLCECPVGMLLENNGRSCTECDNYHFGKNCLQNCSCLYGTCDKKTGCACNKGWGGLFCDVDIDECDNGQLTCLEDNTVCVNTLGGARCSCKSGYTNSSGICTDINECADNSLHYCDQICSNTDGGYSCSCRQGFIKQESCEDIDECAGNHGCAQLCANTAGSYKCYCEDGFYLDLTNRKSCKPENQCDQNETDTCPSNSTCLRKNDEIICSCDKGFQMSQSSDICEDIDECKLDTNPCSHTCTNTDGSFICTCNIGYVLHVDRATCQECISWRYGPDCDKDCNCNITNSELCNPVSGQCNCKVGWTGESCDEDIDECLNETSCPNKSNCTNSNGSFSCKCETGYFKSGGGLCEECDPRHYGDNCLMECTCDTENEHDCDHKTGACICQEGWTGKTCNKDVDECELIPSVCSNKSNSTCFNQIGSYTCACDIGFVEENRECRVCTDWMYGHNCEYSCACVTPHTDACNAMTGDCICKTGWNGTACENDIDECEVDEICQNYSACDNSDGGYICTCNTGYFKTENAQCEVCGMWHFGKDCENKCICVHENTQTCNHVTGDCSCKSGWTGMNCSVDVDECTVNATICSVKANSTCQNTNGSYSCDCDDGFSEQEDSCTACGKWNYGKSCKGKCSCDQENTELCNHMTGNCFCKVGWKGINCSIDIDECAENVQPCMSKANSTCLNANGSYSCKCDEGFYEHENTCKVCEQWNFGKKCEEECSCVRENTDTCNHVTGNCFCKYGWNGSNCSINVDECTDNATVCLIKANSTCKNTNGSFSCECNEGFYDNETLCIVCEQWHYGKQCEEECACVKENTESCNHVTGNCSCKIGWKGDLCSEDIDECAANSSICSAKANSTCQNTNGSFSCDCDNGFREQGDICTNCTIWTFGENCDLNCTCDKSKSQYCDPTDGSCRCYPGWSGNNCTMDMDECVVNDICPDNSSCNNTIGSFLCECHTGYYKNEEDKCLVCDKWYFGTQCEEECLCDRENTDTCNHVTGNCSCKTGWKGTTCAEDVDECTEIAGVCSVKANSTCENTNGSYSCNCDDGFYQQEDVCSVCKLWHYGKECEEECLCDQKNTETCNHVTGNCTCRNGWKGIHCSSDIDECVENVTICTVKANSTCRNANGSYSCDCDNGFNEQGDTCTECEIWHYGKQCQEDCECIQENTQTCSHVTGTCFCKSGWEGSTCSLDIDECMENASICSVKANSNCHNTNGSYSCICDDGFHENGNMCSVCTVWTYGKNCDLNCTCDASKSQYCDPGDGRCTCNPGWNGTNCVNDIDECNINDICPENSSCNNTVGSFYCDCYTGYHKTSEDKCEECSNNTYGNNCIDKCGCNETNSLNENQSCDKMTGDCICKTNWGGTTCSEDIDECEQNKTLCMGEGNTTCLNTVGGYECDCVRGFNKQSDEDCVEESGQTTQRPVGGISIDITVTFEFDLPNGTNLNSAKTYENLRGKCVESLLAFLNLFVTVTVEIEVNDIRPGSVEVDFIIFLESGDSVVATQFMEAVNNLQQGTYMNFDGQNVSASSETYKNLEPCTFYLQYLGGCNSGYICKVEDGLPTCMLEEEEPNVNWSLVIGLSAAGLVLLIITAVLLYVAWRFLERQSNSPHSAHSTQRPYRIQRHYREDDEASDDFWRGRWQTGGLAYAGLRQPTWQSRLSGMWTPSVRGNISTFGETNGMTPKHGVSSRHGDREEWLY